DDESVAAEPAEHDDGERDPGDGRNEPHRLEQALGRVVDAPLEPQHHAERHPRHRRHREPHEDPYHAGPELRPHLMALHVAGGEDLADRLRHRRGRREERGVGRAGGEVPHHPRGRECRHVHREHPESPGHRGAHGYLRLASAFLRNDSSMAWFTKVAGSPTASLRTFFCSMAISIASWVEARSIDGLVIVTWP